MKILKLEASNIKRLRAVEIAPDPDGHLVVISGNNGEGKTSCLDAIMYALAGGKHICDEPIRRGERKGKVRIETEELVIERTFTAKGGQLRVSPRGGAPMSSPQAYLDSVVGRISFDPLSFSRMKPKEQREQLAALVGLDTTDLDQAYAAIYEERAAVNRKRHDLEGALTDIQRDETAPAELVDVAKLVSQLNAADAWWAERSEERQGLEGKKVQRDRILEGRDRALARIEEITAELERLREEVAGREQEAEKMLGEIEAEASELAEREALAPDRAAIKARIESAEAVNARVRANQRWNEHSARVAALKAEGDRLTGKLKSVEDQKKQRIADAKYPIGELEVDEEGVLFKGVPLSQASAAEQIRVSVAIGIAMNPELRVLLVRDASLLDERSLASIAKMATDSDSQLWLESVPVGPLTTVVIEDGMVAGAPAPAVEEEEL